MELNMSSTLNLKLEPATSRYFMNPFLKSNKQQQIDELMNNDWLLKKALLLAKRISSHEISKEELEKGLCVSTSVLIAIF